MLSEDRRVNSPQSVTRVIQILERVNRLDEARSARERQRLHRMLRDAQPPE